MNKCDLAALETAEERLEQLERRVYGNASKGAHKNEFSTPLIPKLAGMSQDIGDSLGRRERIVPLFRKLNELEKYLEPTSAIETGMSIPARAELILGMISFKKSLIAIFGLKHKILNFIKKFENFHEKFGIYHQKI